MQVNNMILQLNDDKYVVGYITLGGDPSDGIEFNGEIPEDFSANYYKYKLSDDDSTLIFDESHISDIEKDNIRIDRNIQCFSIVNRGPVWYNLLTDEQANEMNQWYLAWLNAPDTGVIPKRPSWLGEDGKILTNKENADMQNLI